MKRLLVLLVGVAALATALGAPGGGRATAARERLEAEAELAPFGGSGVRAEIEFVDTGTALEVRGEARGLDPGKTYISLIYDNGSVATGPTACEPTGPALTFAQMFVGTWTVTAEGEGRLRATKTGASYTPIGSFRTVSVRVVTGAGLPQRVACGLVVPERD